MIEFTKSRYFLGLWFIGHNPDVPIAQRYDWLMAVWREQADGPWTLVYRTRRHAGEDPWEAQDTKSWWKAEGDSALTDDAILAKIETMTSQLSGAAGQPCASVIVQGDGERAFEIFCQQPWVHMQVQEPD